MSALLDQAKVQTNRIVHDVEETLREATRRCLSSCIVSQPDDELFHQVQTLANRQY